MKRQRFRDGKKRQKTMTKLNDKEIMDLRLALNNLHAKLMKFPVPSVLWAFVTVGRSILQMTIKDKRKRRIDLAFDSCTFR